MKRFGTIRVVAILAALMVAMTVVLPVLGAERGYPIPGQLQFTVWTPMNPVAAATCKSYADILAFQEAEKRTGVKIKWSNPVGGLDAEQFNLMLVSRDLPDMFSLPTGQSWFSVPGGAEKFYNDKIILKLNDLIDKYAPNFKSVLRNNPEARKQLMTDDGSIYYIPMLRLAPEINVFLGFQIRQDWLDKLGLKVPTTIDQWYNVLKAFKTRDPNGNGKADEIPFTATRLNLGPEFTRFPWAWGVCFGSSYGNGFMQVNGKAVYGPIQKEFKGALEFMNKLYKEGLLDPDFAIQERKQMDVKVLSDQAGAWFGYAGAQLGTFMTAMEGKEPKSFKISGAPFPIGPAKKPYNFDRNLISPVSGYGMAISTACKNPAAAMKWLDYAFSKEGHMLYNFGVEGITYQMIKGYPTYTDLIMKNPDGLTVSKAMTKYFMSAQNWSMVQDVRYFDQYQSPLGKEAIAIWAKGKTDRTFPPVTFSSGESQTISSKLTEINTYVTEMYLKFIMGTVPLSDFDKYVNQVKQMGIEEVTKIHQAALDRFNKRK
ncbi:MAG: extracellular solute-binding protein [Bacteroidota bacterium]